MPQLYTELKNQSPDTTAPFRDFPRGGLILHPPVIAPAQTLPIRTEFIRLPKTGKACPHTGLSRSTLNSLILPCAANGYKPPVRSYVLRQHGRLKGIRLIDFESLCSYIRNQTESTVQVSKPENLPSFRGA